jgi:excisionase family DNA binding protein
MTNLEATPATGQLMTAKDVRAVLRVSRGETYRLLNGPIPTVRLGRAIRVRSEALNAWLREQEQAAD